MNCQLKDYTCPYVSIIYMFTYPVSNIYVQVISFFVKFTLIKHILDLVELELCTPTAPPMWSIRLQGGKRLVDQLLNAGTVLRISLVPLVSGEFKFYWASSTSDALARIGEWYNQLVIHTATCTCSVYIICIIVKYVRAASHLIPGKLSHGMPFPPSAQYAKNVGEVAFCADCTKPRVLYATKKVCPAAKTLLLQELELLEYTCGASFKDVISEERSVFQDICAKELCLFNRSGNCLLFCKDLP